MIWPVSTQFYVATNSMSFEQSRHQIPWASATTTHAVIIPPRSLRCSCICLYTCSPSIYHASSSLRQNQFFYFIPYSLDMRVTGDVLTFVTSFLERNLPAAGVHTMLTSLFAYLHHSSRLSMLACTNVYTYKKMTSIACSVQHSKETKQNSNMNCLLRIGPYFFVFFEFFAFSTPLFAEAIPLDYVDKLTMIS